MRKLSKHFQTHTNNCDCCQKWFLKTSALFFHKLPDFILIFQESVGNSRIETEMIILKFEIKGTSHFRRRGWKSPRWTWCLRRQEKWKIKVWYFIIHELKYWGRIFAKIRSVGMTPGWATGSLKWAEVSLKARCNNRQLKKIFLKPWIYFESQRSGESNMMVLEIILILHESH